MKKEEKASISIMKIICISIILMLISGIGVMAFNTELKDVKIILQNGYEMPEVTTKSTVSEILEEKNIVLSENQKTIPDLNSEIKSGDTIKITDQTGTTVTYTIYHMFYTTPDDVSFMERDVDINTREITLQTCNDDSSERLIIFAKDN